MPTNEAFIRAADVARIKIREGEERLAVLLREAEQVKAEMSRYQAVIDIAEGRPVIVEINGKGTLRAAGPRIDFGPIVRGGGFKMVEEVLRNAGRSLRPSEICAQLKGRAGAPSDSSVFNYLQLGTTSGLFVRVGRGLYEIGSEHKEEAEDSIGAES